MPAIERIEALVANLIEELLNLGYKKQDLKWILKQYGYSLKDIQERYGL
jgi:Zn-dependent M16 (insulinase) family peptidase